jgi:hypothetical protein
MFMIQVENVSPGYCFIQVLIDDALLPHLPEINEHSYRDIIERILLKKSTMSTIGWSAGVRHDPAFSEQDVPGYDNVPAFPCKSSPVQARHWFNQHRVGHWTTNDMMQYCKNRDILLMELEKQKLDMKNLNG